MNPTEPETTPKWTPIDLADARVLDNQLLLLQEWKETVDAEIKADDDERKEIMAAYSRLKAANDVALRNKIRKIRNLETSLKKQRKILDNVKKELKIKQLVKQQETGSLAQF